MPKTQTSHRRRSAQKGETPTFNATRAIYIQGEINEQLTHALTPQILQLKANSLEPITVFIDSPGGSVGEATKILGLLYAVDGQGQRPRIITVATGTAWSAAADFLTHGDYVLAFRHAVIGFHGNRIDGNAITRECAEGMENALEQWDLEAARKAALVVFARFLELYARFSEDVVATRKERNDVLKPYDELVTKTFLDVPALASCLYHKAGDAARPLLKAALDETCRIRRILSLYRDFTKNKIDPAIVELLSPKLKSMKKRVRIQVRVLEVVIASKLLENEDWDLRGESFQSLESDCIQVLSLVEGFFADDLLDLLQQHRSIFFTQKELAGIDGMTQKAFDSGQKTKTRFDGIVQHAYKRAEPLWQFVGTLCRLLNEDEHEMDPFDAWHLGLIDEIVGTPLAHRRLKPRELESLKQQLPVADLQKFDE